MKDVRVLVITRNNVRQECGLSRVPNVGEKIKLGVQTYNVKKIRHLTDLASDYDAEVYAELNGEL